MKLLRKLTAFILVFGLLAGTVAAMSAAVFVDDSSDDFAPVALAPKPVAPADDDLSADDDVYQPRFTAPSRSNPYYYSDYNVFYLYGWGMPNCTCYAWGRAYEITGVEPDLCLYSAHYWYDYNKEYGIYPYGSEPKLGAIACWRYSSGTSGHVAVVEKIENGMITFSNSAYSGTVFYTNTAPIDDPSDGRETWIFQGYIYIGDYENPDDPYGDTDADKPADGKRYLIDDTDGVNLRRGAGLGSTVIGGIACGEEIVVTDTVSADGYTWGCTVYYGVKGWFALDFAVPVEEPVEEPPEEPDVPPTEAPTDPVTEAPTEDPTQAILIGDVNEDGEITILDATRIQLILVGMVNPTGRMMAAADYDRDDDVTILDATMISYDLAFRRV